MFRRLLLLSRFESQLQAFRDRLEQARCKLHLEEEPFVVLFPLMYS